MASNQTDLGFDVYDERFQNPLVAAEYLESLRWPKGPVCPHCGESERKPYALKSKTRRLWKCAACRKQYTVTVGTIFEGSHIGLHKWLLAFYLLCSSKKGMSAHQLHRMLGITYKSAWFMGHRIRYAMQQPPFQARLTGTVEVDETYVGGKYRGPNLKPVSSPIDPQNLWAPNPNRRRARTTGRGSNKVPVLALVERGGEVRSFRMANVTGESLREVIRENVDRAAHIRTDAFPSYRGLDREFASHETVTHMDEWVRGDIHTNTVESYFAILKRGIDGVYHHVSEAHLPRYLAEFDYRYNTRGKSGYSDARRTERALKQVSGKRLRYAETRGGQAEG
jgi:transposase-like protein